MVSALERRSTPLLSTEEIATSVSLKSFTICRPSPGPAESAIWLTPQCPSSSRTVSTSAIGHDKNVLHSTDRMITRMLIIQMIARLLIRLVSNHCVEAIIWSESGIRPTVCAEFTQWNMT
jgi:hypothetical protein